MSSDGQIGVAEGCSRAFIPRENGVLQMDRICYCGKPGGHELPHVCLDCGGRWGEGETPETTGLLSKRSTEG